MLEELQRCLAEMYKQIASNQDNVPTMLWKSHNFHSKLLYFEAVEAPEGSKLSAFSKSNIITIPKKVTYHNLQTTEASH